MRSQRKSLKEAERRSRQAAAKHAGNDDCARRTTGRPATSATHAGNEGANPQRGARHNAEVHDAMVVDAPAESPYGLTGAGSADAPSGVGTNTGAGDSGGAMDNEVRVARVRRVRGCISCDGM